MKLRYDNCHTDSCMYMIMIAKYDNRKTILQDLIAILKENASDIQAFLVEQFLPISILQK